MSLSGFVFGQESARPSAAAAPPADTLSLALKSFPMRPGANWVYEETGEAQAEDGHIYFHNNRYTVRVADVRRTATGTIARMVKYDRSGMTTFQYRASGGLLTVEPDPDDPGGTHEIVRINGALPHSAASYVFPLTPGAHWGGTTAEREDHRYEYFVRRLERVVVPAGTFARCAYIIYRTLPDHHSIWFEPGVGVVKYQYAHHGTVLRIRGKLMQYFIPGVGPKR